MSEDRFQRIVGLVRDGMRQRFRRDGTAVVHVDGAKIKVELAHEPGSFVSRAYTPADLAQRSPRELADELLAGYADQQKRTDLLAYAKAQFQTAADVRPLEDDFDREIMGIVQLKFGGARVTAGFSRELWDDAENFEQLRAQMERHRWKETVNGAQKQRALLGRDGWLDWD